MLSASQMADLKPGPIGNWLLDGLAPETLAQLRPHFRLAKLRPGQVLWEQGSWLGSVYFPLSGAVSILLEVDEAVASIEVAIVGSEGLVGASSLLCEGSEGAAVGSALVLVAGSAMQMSAGVLREQARQSVGLLNLLHRYVRARHVQTSYYAACNGRHSLEERLARWLLAIVDRSEDNAIEVSHAQIANVLGVRRAGITSALAGFKTSGLIGAVPGRIAVLDRAGLETMSCHCYFAIKQEFEVFRRVS